MKKFEKFNKDEDRLYKRIYGGLSMPGRRPGFCCIVGETCALNPVGERELVLLDEGERWDSKELIELASGFDFRYMPERWYGDGKDLVSRAIIRAMNISLEGNKGERSFTINHSLVLNNPKPIQYIFPILKVRLEGVGKKLFPANSLIGNYMRQIPDEEVVALDVGDYPAIESLAFCVLELTRPQSRRPRQKVAISDYKII